MSRVIVGDHVEETEIEDISLRQIKRKVTQLTEKIRQAQQTRSELNVKISEYQTERAEWVAFRDTLEP